MNDPRQIETAMDALRPGWRARRDKRKSPWNFVCAVLGFCAAYFYAKYFCDVAIWFNIQLYPGHARLTHSFFAYLNNTSSPSVLLMGLPLCIPAMVAGFLTGNVITWLIPQARRAMESEAGNDRELTFTGANFGLLKYGGIVSAGCFLLSAIGIFAFRS